MATTNPRFRARTHVVSLTCKDPCVSLFLLLLFVQSITQQLFPLFAFCEFILFIYYTIKAKRVCESCKVSTHKHLPAETTGGSDYRLSRHKVVLQDRMSRASWLACYLQLICLQHITQMFETKHQNR